MQKLNQNLSDREYETLRRAIAVFIDMENDMALERVSAVNLCPGVQGVDQIVTTETASELRREINEVINDANTRHSLALKFGIELNDKGYTATGV